ncbi:hypothetical protein ACV1D3_19345, partial [Aeromonas sanarellii]
MSSATDRPCFRLQAEKRATSCEVALSKRLVELGGGDNQSLVYLYGDGIHLTVAHKREWSYGFKPDNK